MYAQQGFSICRSHFLWGQKRWPNHMENPARSTNQPFTMIKTTSKSSIFKVWISKYTKSSQTRDPKFAKFPNLRLRTLLISSKLAVLDPKTREFCYWKVTWPPLAVNVKPLLLIVWVSETFNKYHAQNQTITKRNAREKYAKIYVVFIDPRF